MLELKGIYKTFNAGTVNEKRAIDNLNLTLENGDFVTMDFGCVYEGYCSDMTRTVVVGKADAKQREVYDLCRRMTEDTEASVRAGVTGTSCYEASLKAIKDTEYLPYNYTGLCPLH